MTFPTSGVSRHGVTPKISQAVKEEHAASTAPVGSSSELLTSPLFGSRGKDMFIHCSQGENTDILRVSQNQRSVNVRFWSLYPQVFVDVGYSWVQNQDIDQPRKKTISQDIQTKYLNYLKLSQKMVHTLW